MALEVSSFKDVLLPCCKVADFPSYTKLLGLFFAKIKTYQGLFSAKRKTYQDPLFAKRKTYQELLFAKRKTYLEKGLPQFGIRKM